MREECLSANKQLIEGDYWFTYMNYTCRNVIAASRAPTILNECRWIRLVDYATHANLLHLAEKSTKAPVSSLAKDKSSNTKSKLVVNFYRHFFLRKVLWILLNLKLGFARRELFVVTLNFLLLFFAILVKLLRRIGHLSLLSSGDECF